VGHKIASGGFETDKRRVNSIRTRDVFGSVSAESSRSCHEPFPDLDTPVALELLGRAPNPDQAARLTRATLTAAWQPSPHVEDRVGELLEVLGARNMAATGAAVGLRRSRFQWGRDHRHAQPADRPARVGVGEHFWPAPARWHLRQRAQPWHDPRRPDPRQIWRRPDRDTDAKVQENYVGTSPITKASGTKKIVLARYARNRRLGDALQQCAFCSMRGSPGATA
jgi:hypothetical protein